jgi:hypothetical protein
MPTPPGQPVLECVVTLLEVDPPVWRRLLVPGSVRLDKLHRMVQAVMGWEDHHLHSFEIGGIRYGQLFDEHPDDEIDEQSVTVVTACASVDRVAYEYDFGDGWEHEIVIKAVQWLPMGLKAAVCLDGANACPPEDCGGAGGYEDLLHVLNDPSHGDHRDLVDWIGGAFDPTAFDLALTNARLQKVR